MKTRRFVSLTLIITLLLLGLLLLSSCASGPKFTKVDTIPEDKGVVYIYRPTSPVGMAVVYQVIANSSVIMPLQNGGYYAYFAKPGENEFQAATESISSVTLDVKPGQTYYIKGTLGIGFAVGRPRLAIVPADVGEKEITNCKCLGVKK
jgi:Protein of unknown function (DUF2846)